MGPYEKIYLANNLEALELLAFRSLSNLDLKKLKFTQICNALGKLYKESQMNALDQEKLYIMLYRYLAIYEHLLKTQEDKNFINLRFGSEHRKVQLQFKETKNSLEHRYEEVIRTSQPTPEVDDKNMIVEDVPQRIFNDEFITCQQLYSALQTNSNILLVDARPDFDYSNSHFDRLNCINVPEQCISPGLSANALGKKLPEKTQTIWEKRDSFDVIVLYDWNSTLDNFPMTKLNKLRSALIDWDLNRNYSERPVILNGGYMEMLQTYPTVCINPHVYLWQKDDELDELLELDNIVYPNESDNRVEVMSAPHEAPSVTGEENGIAKDDIIKISRQELKDQFEFNAQAMKKVEKGQTDPSVSHLRQEVNSLDAPKGFESNEFEEEIDEFEMMRRDHKFDSIIAEERVKALERARALKPKNGSNNNIHKRETDRPVINRATKPTMVTRSQTIRMKAAALDNMTAGIVGMRNIRNTCYMNTIVNCLRNLPEFIQFFCRGEYVIQPIRDPSAIIRETATLFRTCFSPNSTIVDPSEFYNKICALEANYRLGHHEDCMEFFLFLLNHLIEDCSTDFNAPAAMTTKQKAWYNQFQGKTSVFINMFYHQIRIKQNCTLCDKKAIKFEIESSFMLPVEDTDNEINLSDLMKDYMDSFIVAEYCCAQCKKPVNNEKEICYEPKIMVVILKRYKQVLDHGELKLKKVSSPVNFPKTRFKLGKCYYKLYAVAMHMGEVSFGHYSAAALTSKGWYEFNDEIVKPININDFSIKTRACAFFYSMCDDY